MSSTHEPAPQEYPQEDYPEEPMTPQEGNGERPAYTGEEDKPRGDVDPNADAPAFCSPQNLGVCLVQAVGATLNGYSIGFVGVYSTLYGLSNNCAKYKAQKGCETLANQDCMWIVDSSPAGGHCGWATGTCSDKYSTEATCVSPCAWSYPDEECQNPSGYTSSDNGIFAGSMILGCMFGSFFAGPLASTIGSKLSFLLVGIVGIVCSVMYHVSCAENEFWVLIAGRFVIGLFLGVVGVACPLYVDQNAHPKWKRMIGVMFQLFTTFGIFIAGTMGLALGQSVWFDKNKDQMLMARMQGLCAFSTFFSIIMVIMGIVCTESRAKFHKGDDDEEGGVQLDPNEYGWCEMLPRLLMGIVMAGTLQLTGINAVMNYAPTIMGSLGLAPLVGNFIVMVWNFVTTIVSIPLASVFTMRQLFLAGSIFTSCMCMFLCGIPVYPGVTKTKKAKDGVAITGILLFIMGFEFCVGPCYYVLTQDMFPPSFRPKGASFTQVVQFIFNVIINVCYPIATEDISGGPSGNQDKGQAIAFIFFGGLGIICFIIQVFFLHPWEGKDIGEENKADSAHEPSEDYPKEVSQDGDHSSDAN